MIGPRILADIGDYREQARRRLPRFLFDYIDGGAFTETTLRRNVEDLRSIVLRQSVLRDVSALTLKTTLFGQECAMPIALAPNGRPWPSASRIRAKTSVSARSAAKFGARASTGATFTNPSSLPARCARTLDHGQSCARATSRARTGLRLT